jgi:carbonic anhydrase
MDARIDPAKALFLEEGDAHVLRNAGALVTDDVLRSLALSHWKLGTEEVIVIGHTGCGLFMLDQRELTDQIGEAARGVDFMPFRDLDASVRESVRRVRESPLLPDSFAATGMVYDVATGRVRLVNEGGGLT